MESSSEPTTPPPEVPPVETSYLKYIVGFVVVAVIVAVGYFAYGHFMQNKKETVAVEKDEPIIDFNLREAIKELQTMQNKILKTLSQSYD
jgi:hypothetical protein